MASIKKETKEEAGQEALGTTEPPRKKPMTMKEYTDSVKKWFQHQHTVHQFNYFLWVTMIQQQAIRAYQLQQSSASGHPRVPAAPPPRQQPAQRQNVAAVADNDRSLAGRLRRQIASWQRAFALHEEQLARPQQQIQDEIDATDLRTIAPGRLYKIPPIHKRFIAEMIDFFLLFVLKVIVTYIAADYFNLIDIQKYDLEMIADTAEAPNLKAALELTSDIVALEFIHRIVVCLYETVCLQSGAVQMGGGTPGKIIVGIKVLYCEQVTSTPWKGIVLVHPASNLGWSLSLLRAIVKNFSMAFFFPLSFTILFSPHSRAAYDTIAKSVVVDCKVVRQQQRRNQSNQQARPGQQPGAAHRPLQPQQLPGQQAQQRGQQPGQQAQQGGQQPGAAHRPLQPQQLPGQHAQQQGQQAQQPGQQAQQSGQQAQQPGQQSRQQAQPGQQAQQPGQQSRQQAQQPGQQAQQQGQQAQQQRQQLGQQAQELAQQLGQQAQQLAQQLGQLLQAQPPWLQLGQQAQQPWLQAQHPLRQRGQQPQQAGQQPRQAGQQPRQAGQQPHQAGQQPQQQPGTGLYAAQNPRQQHRPAPQKPVQHQRPHQD